MGKKRKGQEGYKSVKSPVDGRTVWVTVANKAFSSGISDIKDVLTEIGDYVSQDDLPQSSIDSDRIYDFCSEVDPSSCSRVSLFPERHADGRLNRAYQTNIDEIRRVMLDIIEEGESDINDYSVEAEIDISYGWDEIALEVNENVIGLSSDSREDVLPSGWYYDDSNGIVSGDICSGLRNEEDEKKIKRLIEFASSMDDYAILDDSEYSRRVNDALDSELSEYFEDQEFMDKAIENIYDIYEENPEKERLKNYISNPKFIDGLKSFIVDNNYQLDIPSEGIFGTKYFVDSDDLLISRISEYINNKQ